MGHAGNELGGLVDEYLLTRGQNAPALATAVALDVVDDAQLQLVDHVVRGDGLQATGAVLGTE